MPSLHSSVGLLFQELKTNADGLTSQEAAARLKQYGPNSFEQARSMSDVEAFLRQFLNPLVLVLLISAGLSYFLGEMRGGIIISVLVLFSVCLQFYHERRSTKAAAALSRRVSVHATVLRDGVKQDVELSAVVPGDVVFLSAGDMIPGDARILIEKNLYVNQASLTGESFPVEKRAEGNEMPEANIAEMD